MSDQDSLLREHWWYSVIAASPTPENGEQANVAVVLGNGQASHLSYRRNLPRLCGIAAPDVIAIFEGMLSSVKERVDRGMDVAQLRAIIGPQMRVMSPIPLYQQPSDELVSRLVRRFLESPRSRDDDENDFEFVHVESNTLIDAALSRALSARFEVAEDVTFRDLYGVKSPRRIPRMARVVRSVKRDLLLDGVAVSPGHVSDALREGAAQIGKAFFDYNSLRQQIREVSGKEIRMIGFLHHMPGPEPSDVEDANAYIRQVWRSSSAEVVDAGTDGDTVLQTIERSLPWLDAR